MAKRKLQRFDEMKTFPHVFEPTMADLKMVSAHLKGNWNSTFFGNNNPIVLELGCGKGEYTVSLAEKFPNTNFIGIDIKGARMWVGAKSSFEKGLENVAFLRTRIEFVHEFFAMDEISEIWITFPDPQIRKLKKRLTSAFFLNLYKCFLKSDGIIHLKTDSDLMFGFTNDIASKNNLPISDCCTNIYAERPNDSLLTIKTFYEKQYITRNIPIKYIRFELTKRDFENPEENAELLEQEVQNRKLTGTNQIVRMKNIC